MSRSGWHGGDLPLLLHLHGASMVLNQHHIVATPSPAGVFSAVPVVTGAREIEAVGG